ncbi:hypothetical protein [Rhabdochlamydiaceae symbiont of Dictyostelium giganteum]|uniref:hypothetical protein n=1 Tax=Rhabdochlamydiaceae symbiont of Dictyostelium giganteum TaxID=3342349 RepID=UPI0038517D2F
MDQDCQQTPPHDIATPHKPQVKEKELSDVVKAFVEQLKSVPSLEEKIQMYLAQMRLALGEKKPRFKDYWDLKQLCLPLFKEKVSQNVRTQLWEEYTQLSGEARHLKSVLDEQSTFAIEQIELAIGAVEHDLSQRDEWISQKVFLELPEECYLLSVSGQIYAELQQELVFLNTFATRITALRKEIIQTEMRIRFKNKFFDRLSLAGDHVFPRRRELIQKVSAQFLHDVMEFSGCYFSESASYQRPPMNLRQEIKALQTLAKVLTLDAATFNQTRLELSKCWNLLKEKDLERKKDFEKKKEVYEHNQALVMEKIGVLAERCQDAAFTSEEASKLSSEILAFMKTVDLGRDSVQLLRDEIAKAKAPITAKIEQIMQAREKENEINQRQRVEKIEQFKANLSQVIKDIDNSSLESLFKEREKFQQQLITLQLTSAEKELLENEIKIFRDLIIDKKEKAILSLTPEQKQSLESLYLHLTDWKEQKNEIRTQLEVYRKALAGSGFDFEKAIRYKELVENEKLRLDRVNATIEKLEKQIDEVEGS